MIIDNSLEPGQIDLWIEAGKSFQLIDITEENVLKRFQLKCDWIPVRKLLEHLNFLESEIPVVLCCYTGESSFLLMNVLHLQHSMNNIYSLKSGINGWKGI